jgi:hypothetical protein
LATQQADKFETKQFYGVKCQTSAEKVQPLNGRFPSRHPVEQQRRSLLTTGYLKTVSNINSLRSVNREHAASLRRLLSALKLQRIPPPPAPPKKEFNKGEKDDWMMVGECLLVPVPSIRFSTLIPSLTFFKKMCKRRGRIKHET